jgi:hypothetical protein
MKKLTRNSALPVTIFLFLFISIFSILLIRKNQEIIRNIFRNDLQNVSHVDTIKILKKNENFVLISDTAGNHNQKIKPNAIMSARDSVARAIDSCNLRNAIWWDYLPIGSTIDDLTVHIRSEMQKDGRLKYDKEGIKSYFPMLKISGEVKPVL